jgi:hypothetical protein
MHVTTSTLKQHRHVIELTGSDLIDVALQRLQHMGVIKELVHDEASVSVAIPRGGDYSGSDLDIDEETTVKVTILITEEEGAAHDN